VGRRLRAESLGAKIDSCHGSSIARCGSSVLGSYDPSGRGCLDSEQDDPDPAD
jgi:hypothetical protein